MSDATFLLVIMPDGDRMIRNVADIRYVRITENRTGELVVLARLFGDGPDSGEKMLCVGPDSVDYFDWLIGHSAINLLSIWEDTGGSTDDDPIELGTEDQEE